MNKKDITGAGEIGKEIVRQVGEVMKEPVANLVTPSTKIIGERLSNLLDVIFTPIELSKVCKDHKIVSFKRSLENKVSAIPENKKVLPPLNVVGPALESAKYYIEEEEPREMFARLIAKSMNIETTDSAHPSFVEIIKRMSSRDASNLISFGNVANHPIVKYRQWQGTSFWDFMTNIFLLNPKYADLHNQSISISVLISLGLVIVDYSRAFDPSYYTEFYETEDFRAFSEMCMQSYKLDPSFDIPQEVRTLIETSRRIEVIPGMIELTDLGTNFKHICID